MIRLKRDILACITFLLSALSHAETTWVPINVGDITTFVPYVPAESLAAPVNVQISINNGISTLTWDDVEHASRYEIQALDSQGEWVSILITEELSVVIDSRFTSYASVRVMACTYNSCDNSVNWSVSVVTSDNPQWLNTTPTNVADSPITSVGYLGDVNLDSMSIKGKAGVSGGQASYHIPIELPPGRNGVKPSVSLSYNSQSGNNLSGVGWSLSTGGSISRCSPNYAQDPNNNKRAVTLDASDDRLCLNGQRLVLTDNTYGQSGAVYRTEMDSFVKVVQHGAINDSDSSFTAHYSDGSRITYGANVNSRAYLSPNFSGVAQSWKVTQVIKSDGANVIDYEYIIPDVGEHLVKSIYYTGSQAEKGDRKVTFEYEDRNDTQLGNIAGHQLNNTKRLRYIKTFIGAREIQRYHLEYTYSQYSTRSLLISIARCGFYNSVMQCTPKTTFDWAQQAGSFQSESTPVDTAELVSLVAPTGDLNGDGVVDWPGYNVNAEGEFTANTVDINNCFINPLTTHSTCNTADFNLDGISDSVRLSKGALNTIEVGLSVNGVANWQDTGAVVGNAQSSIMHIGDLNGDAYPDLVVIHQGSLESPVYFYPNTKTSTPFTGSNKQLITTLTGYSKKTQTNLSYVGDMNGDGIGDFIFYVGNSSGNSTGFKPTSLWLTRFDSANNVSFYKQHLNFESDTHYQSSAQYTWQRFQVIVDVNGDGLADWLGFYKPDENNSRLFVRFNRSGRFDGPIDTGLSISSRQFVIDHTLDIEGSSDIDIRVRMAKHANAYRVIDLDGDGKSEIIFPNTRVVDACYTMSVHRGTKELCGDEIFDTITNRSYYNFRSVPERFDYNIYQYAAITYKNGTFTKYVPNNLYGASEHTVVVDGFGNGLPDVVFNYGCGNQACRFESGAFGGFEEGKVNVNRNYGTGNANHGGDYQPYDYLLKATDGLANTTQWRYRPLASGEASAGQAFYEKNYQHMGDGYLQFTSSMYAVQSLKKSNSIGGLHETQYAYKGAMYHPQGRGFTGFKETTEKDMQRNIVTRSTYKQKFPETGLLEKQEVTVNNQLISSLVNTWSDNLNHNERGIYHNILTNSVQQRWDIDGTIMSEIESDTAVSDVDAYGNVKKRLVSITDYLDGQATTYRTETTASFSPTESNWWLNKLNWQQRITFSASRGWGDDPILGLNNNPDVEQWQKSTFNAWDTTHRKPTSITTTASGTSCSRNEQVNFNDFGLPSWQQVQGQIKTGASCSSDTARRTTFTYTKNGSSVASDGYLPYTVTNAKGHKATTQYDIAFGAPTQITGPNGVVTSIKLDGVGRAIESSKTGSPTRYMRYLLASDGDNAPQYARTMVKTASMGSPKQEAYVDSLGRELRSATQGFLGSYQYVDKRYDGLGRLTHESLPYFDYEAPVFTEFGDFDALSRPQWRRLSHGLVSRYEYHGLRTDISVGSDARAMSRIYSSQGWLLATTDALGGRNRFSYDGFGQPLVIEDANSNPIIAYYNGFGHKTQVNDPNQGVTTFSYNTLGEMVGQSDANGVSQSISLDTLGRISQKTVSGGQNPHTATFTWDTRKQGLLTAESANSVTRNYYYNAALQPVQTDVSQDGVTRSIKQQYDSAYGRIKGLEYPNGLTLAYDYNNSGYLTSTKNAATGYVYRTVTEKDAANRITQANLAHSEMSLNSVYDADSGVMDSTQVTKNGSVIHGHNYNTYDEYLNIRNERNVSTNLSKSYTYDTLNRLTRYQVNDNAPNINLATNYAYDAVGNLLKKSDYSKDINSAYRYSGDSACVSNAGSNAICRIEKLNGSLAYFNYDERGNLTTGDGLSLTYNAMDKPLIVSGTRNGASQTISRFTYASDGMRSKQVRTIGNSTITTYYVDKLFEQDNDGSWRAYIDDIAVFSYTPERKHQLQFTLRDRLGSATTLVDPNANIISQRYFDPFGRSATTGVQGGLNDLWATNRNRRGFTDHEHLDEQQLIHMNGRVYDYNLGRFLSVDPFIMSPGNSQALNPYSYGMNNPLSGTDPTGYIFVSGTLAAIAIYNIYDSISSVADAVSTVSDPNASSSDKITAVAGAIGSVVDPTPGNLGKKAIAGIRKAAVGKKATKVDALNAKSQSTSNTDGGTKKNGAENSQSASGSKPESTSDIGSLQSINNGGPVKPGDTGNYGDLKSQKKQYGETEPMDMDHQPSYKAQEKAAASELGRPLTKAEKSTLKNNTPAVASPREVHQKTSPTYGGRNTAARSDADSKNLSGAGQRDKKIFDDAMKKRQ